jgi:hypothetical protein
MSDTLALARTTLAAAALIVCLGSTGLGAQPTLEKIVDSRDPVPGAPGASWESFRPFFEVAVDGDEIAFLGSSSELDESRDGVYLRRGGSLQVVADSRTTRPGTGGPFGRESFWRVALDEGMLVFVSEDLDSLGAGVYRYDDGGFQVIADRTTTIPGGEPNRFVSFDDVAVDHGEVLFGGTHDTPEVRSQDGLYRAAGGAVTRVVDAATPIPGGSGNFELVGEIGMDASGFAFTRPHPGSSWDDGIYRNLGAGLQTVADLSTVAPHSGTPFESFNAFGYDARAVAFMASAGGGKTAVYLHDGTLRLVASRQTPYPGSGQNFVGFANRLATSKGRVAFMGFWNPPGQPSKIGLFVADGEALTLVAEEGGVLDGRVISEIDLSQGGFDSPHLAFTVAFADGGNALFLSTVPVADPPPPAGPWLTTSELPGFQVKARFAISGGIAGQSVTPCIGETLCIAGAVPDRAELFVRVVGPKPNGKLWPTLVKFSTSRIEVWIEQTGSGVIRYYELPAVTPGEQLLRLDGLADKLGFDP